MKSNTKRKKYVKRNNKKKVRNIRICLWYHKSFNNNKYT